jgi:hypothetical protein
MSLQDLQQDKSGKRKFFNLGVVLLAWMVWHTLPTLFSHHVQAKPAAPLAAVSKPSPAVVPAPPAPAIAPLPVATPAGAAVVAPPPPDPMANVTKSLVGKWEGIATVSLPPHPRTCRLQMEIRKPDKDGAPFVGYSILSCMPIWYGNRYVVTSAVLSGTGDDGVVPSISFDTVVSNIGVAESSFHCGMRSMRVQAFGSNRATAKWQETGPAICGGGEVVLDSRRTY